MADKIAEKKPNVFQNIAKFFRGCKSEVKKIVWPTPRQTFKNMGVVITVIVIIGLFVFGLDRGLYALLNLVMNTGTS
ncbi:MAG: preprotein translocase subunit SecE [Bacillota bacterium]|nr:preprotein translocase subunit SecE [Bacillota bacterium]